MKYICKQCKIKEIWKYTKSGICKSCANKKRKGMVMKKGWKPSMDWIEKLRKRRLGSKHTEDAKQKMRKKANERWANKEERIKQGERIKIAIRKYGHSKGMLGKKHSSETIKKMYARWQNEDYIQKQIKSRKLYPNGLEKNIILLLNEILPNEYKYVGDFQFFLGGKNPDFLNINGQNKLIEIFGDYWHKNENPEKRKKHFKKYGFETLIIWEKEIKNNIEKVKNKIIQFTKNFF